MKMQAGSALEEQKQKLIDIKVVNDKKEADALSYKLEVTLKPYKELNWKTLMAIGKEGADPKLNIALAFRELAENAQKINNLNISPDLLQNLISNDE
jgi:hypothetical protein